MSLHLLITFSLLLGGIGMVGKTAMHIEKIASDERGRTETPWLTSFHSFSFGRYHNLRRINFGTLRVINEDTIMPGKGFDFHHHENMEILTIILEGEVEHKDSAGHFGVIAPYQVQRMTAGSGIEHSEYNHSKSLPVHLLQIWVYPKERDLPPTYETKSFALQKPGKELIPVASDQPIAGAVHIHQDATFFLGNLEGGLTLAHRLPTQKHGAYLFVIDGEIAVGEMILKKGDAAEITKTSLFEIETHTPAKVLLIQVGMSTL